MGITKIKIPSSKGNIAAAIHCPKEKTSKLAILCSGFCDSKDYKHLVDLAEALRGWGYTVVRFDSIGVWESDGDISDYTMTHYLEDIKNVLEHMLRQSSFNHILLGGHSRGGQMAILYAARDPRISVVLGIMASSGPIEGKRREEWERTGISINQKDLPNEPNKSREFRVPFCHVLDRDEYDAIGDVRKIKVPVILIAGELDDIVPADDVKEIFDNANELKKFIIIPNVGHNYRYNDNDVKIVNKEILEQLKEIYLL